MDAEKLELIKINLRWGDICRIADECKCSNQRVSKILNGGVADPDLLVLEVAARIANENKKLKVSINHSLQTLKT